MSGRRVKRLGETNSALLQQTLTLLNAANMIGTANSAWVPCQLVGWTVQDTLFEATATHSNVDGTDDFIMFELPLPTNRGGLKLYIKTLLLGIKQAAVADKVDRVLTSGIRSATRTIIDDDGTDRDAAGDYTYDLGPTEMSSYDVVRIEIQRTVTNAGGLDIALINIDCYYDT